MLGVRPPFLRKQERGPLLYMCANGARTLTWSDWQLACALSTYNSAQSTCPKMPVVSYRIPAELKAALQKLADADKRKLGPYIQIVLEEHVEKAESGKPAGKRKVRFER